MSRTAARKRAVRPDAYEEDYHRWCLDQAALIRAGRFDELDADHLAEEIEDMGGRDRRELSSRLAILLMHLLKHAHQPRRRSRSWVVTILLQRSEIEGILGQSPSLRSRVRSDLGKIYRTARDAAVAETGLPARTFPDLCPWTPEQILDWAGARFPETVCCATDRIDGGRAWTGRMGWNLV
jgi:hypothetical protein